jgi:hypothetical protein
VGHGAFSLHSRRFARFCVVLDLGDLLLLLFITMSSSDDLEAEAVVMCCASRGIAEFDDNKFDACDLLRYCSEKCKEDHRLKHEQACKERATELRDEILFSQPESSHKGDCPDLFFAVFA